MSLTNATCFLLDEFLDLPPGHPARCEHMLRRDLLDRLDQPPELRTFDLAAPDLDAEAGRYEADVAAGGLDLVVLGLGVNGHVALNEPGTPADAPTRVVALASTTQISAAGYGEGPVPTRGITLGLGILLSARRIWLLVTGERKAEILARVLDGPIGPEVPASLLRTHRNAMVMADHLAHPRSD